MKNSKGITLIELVAAIAVIAFAITIFLPAFTTAANKEKSFRAVCANRLKNFGLANTIYSNENDGAFCPIYHLEPNATGQTYMNGQYYDALSWPMVSSFREILKLDTYAKNKRNAPVPSTNLYRNPLNMPADFLCPADKISIDWLNNSFGTLLSYAYNLTDWSKAEQWDLTFKYNTYIGHNAGTIPSPSAKLAFIDAIDWWTAWNNRGADYKNWDKVGQGSIAKYRSSPAYSYGPVLYRHNEGANITFYDGHVQYMRKQKIFVREDYYDGNGNVLPPLQRQPGMWVADMETYLMNQGY